VYAEDSRTSDDREGIRSGDELARSRQVRRKLARQGDTDESEWWKAESGDTAESGW
jgi:hypothetical protein